MNSSRLLLLLTVEVFLISSQVASGDEGVGVEFFEKRIRPVLIRHCYECHSAASSEVKGGLRLDSRDLARQGGESGPAIVPGDTAKSLLLDAIKHDSFEMPPGKKLPEKVIADFAEWIRIGAPDPRNRPPALEEVAELSWKAVLDERRHWWSLQPVVGREPPAAETLGPIDAFIFTRQRAAGIEPGKPASARVLARRLSLVLTGLPPAPEDVDQFSDRFEKAPDAAYEAFVDRLLDSQHFGEHWARHWMDVVRFAETHGYEWNHEIRDAWRYRDYLIRAFNNDVPYDQLVREHIAGDLLESPRVNDSLGINESVIGTAFWRFGELGHDDCVEFPEIRFDALDNQIDTFAKAFQALTISCARCHDHKVDAISTKDYYALVGVLESCSQVVHTLDSPQRIAGVAAAARRLKSQLRQQLGKKWMAAIDQSRGVIAAAISSDRGDGEDASPLEKLVAQQQLDRADPSYILGRLARRDAGADERSTAATDDLRQAQWIWFPEGNAAVDAPIAPRYFRRRIVIPEDHRVAKAWCFFAGDDSVTFYLNGTDIGTGNSHPSLVGVDLTSKLKSGANELAVVNTNGNPAIKPNPGGWIGVIRVEFDRGEPLLFYSDANWKSSRSVGEGWQIGSFQGNEWLDAMELGKAGIAPWGFPWKKQSHVRREVPLASLWPILHEEYTAEQTRREKSNADNFRVWADFGISGISGWSASGLGLSSGPSRAGEFTLTHEGDQVVAAILPAGLYTNVTSARLNGSLRSPWIPKDKKYVSVQLVGDGRSMVRPVVDTCGLNEFAGGGLEYLAGGVTKWKRLPTSAGGAHRSFVELTTKSDNPRWPDRPGRAGTTDAKELESPRSSFGVMRAVLHDSPAAPLPDLKHLLALFEQTGNGVPRSGQALDEEACDPPSDETGIAAVYQTVARQAVEAWQEDRATDADVHWINWLLKAGLLPNSATDDPQLDELLKRYRSVESTLSAPRVVAGLADQGNVEGFTVLRGGDPSQALARVPPRYIEVIATGAESFGSRGSGRRDLANLIATANNPLTARVMVNRVWHHLFGRGIVSTPDDFGAMGEKPTHPELLDFLAAGFVEDGWSIKGLIRRITLTRTFRQSSLPAAQAVQLDPANLLLHHYSARRLSAESVRDTILAVSGRLDAKLFGPSIHPHRKDEKDYRKLWSGPLDGHGRRSIYTKVTRMEGPQFLELFDFPNPMSTRGRRDRTNVPAQALAMLNDPFVISQAAFWAEQLVSDASESIEQRVQSMFRRALGRLPSENEQRRLVKLIRELAKNGPVDDAAILRDKSIWQDAAHAVFNMKEVIYVR